MESIMNYNQNKIILKLFNLSLEQSIKISKFEKEAFDTLLIRIKSLVSADKISKDSTIMKLSIKK